LETSLNSPANTAPTIVIMAKIHAPSTLSI
jgi:hypothetical protein